MQQEPIQPLNTNDNLYADNVILDNLSQFMDKHHLSELVHSFIDRADKHIQKAIKSVTDHDGENLRFALHTLKGSSANVGLLELSELCANAEKCIKDNSNINFSDVAEQLPNIVELLETGKQHLNAYVSRL